MKKKKGIRWKKEKEFMRKEMDRKKMKVEKGENVRWIEIEGMRENGVNLDKDGNIRKVKERREVIIDEGDVG